MCEGPALASPRALLFCCWANGISLPETRVSLEPFGLTKIRPERGRVLRIAGVFALAVTLGSCGSAPLPTYDLSAPVANLKARPLRGVLVIPEPVASSPVDGDRIAVRSGPSAVAVVKDAQWVERLPRLLQSRLIQAFENARLLRSVSRPGDGITPDYALTWEIRRFEMDATTGKAVVELSVKVLTPGGRVIAAQIFSAQAPGDPGNGAAASLALDAASNNVLRQIVAWASLRV
jgi:cholesterol transport system auxiliary component